MTFRENSNPTRATRLGFTLVELLVVITIIGILAGLALVALSGVPGAVQDTAVKMELTQIGTAIEQYKQNRGSFPPDCSSYYNAVGRRNAVNRHLNVLFPQRAEAYDDPSNDNSEDQASLARLKALGTSINLVNPTATGTGAYTLARLDPSEVYVLFLMGFSPDVERPLTGDGERTPLFEFDETRLTDLDNDGWWSYTPKYNDSEIVYFNSKSYFNSTAGEVASYSGTLATGTVRPYGTPTSTGAFKWVNDNTFQLISAGRDGDFGVDFTDVTDAKIYSSGLASSITTAPPVVTPINYSLEDLDNITNFTEGSTLEADEDLE